MCYRYCMYKDAGQVHIDELGEFPIDAHNGVEIKVYLKSSYDLENIIYCLDKLEGFSDVYVNSNLNQCYVENSAKTCIQAFNDRVYKKYNTFTMSSLAKSLRYHSKTSYSMYTRDSIMAKILLGNVVYPLSADFTNKLPMDLKRFIEDLPILIHVPIGSIDITPNRENLLYSNKTVTFLTQRLNAVKEEISSIICTKYDLKDRDFCNFFDYANQMTCKEYSFFSDGDKAIDQFLNFKISSKYLTKKYTYKQQELNLDWEELDRIAQIFLHSNRDDFFYGLYNRHKICKASSMWNTFYNIFTLNKLKYWNLYKKTKAISKKERFYLKELHKDIIIVKPISIKIIYAEIKKAFNKTPNNISESLQRDIIKDLFTLIKNIPALESSSMPEEIVKKWDNLHAEELKEKRLLEQSSTKVTAVNEEEFHIKVLRKNQVFATGLDNCVAKSILTTIDDLRKAKVTYVYADYSQMDYLKLAHLSKAKFKKITIIGVPKRKYKEISELPNTISVLEYLDVNTSKPLIKALTELTIERFIREKNLYLWKISYFKEYENYIELLEKSYYNRDFDYALNYTNVGQELWEAWQKSPYYTNILERLNNKKMLKINQALSILPSYSYSKKTTLALLFSFAKHYKLDYIKPKYIPTISHENFKN